MLCSLHIENIAVIEKTDISFSQGFNVLTGETGAGKSIIIDSIEMLLGERASKDLIRSGQSKAFVGAVFFEEGAELKEKFLDFGLLWEDDGSVLIQRELLADGKSVARINGRIVTLSVLKEIGRLLINIHGQHDNQALLYPENHLKFIDYFAKNDELIAEYKKELKIYNEICAKIEEISLDNSEKERLIETLSYQIKEIEDASLQENEDEELQTQKKVLLNAEKIINNSGFSYELLKAGEQNILDMLTECIDALESVGEYAEPLSEIAVSLQNAKYEIEEQAEMLSDFNSELDFSENDLNRIESRLDVIYRLKRKYGATIEDIAEFYENACEKLGAIQKSDEGLLKLQGLKAKSKLKLLELAKSITKTRKESATRFEEQIKDELGFLDMARVNIKVSFEECRGLDGEIKFLQSGTDTAQFLIATNVGEDLKPLSKIASGGEMSRIMLCIKNVFADGESINTLIFDEVDSGVSGKQAHKIGLKLKNVSQNKQVICVTHLAQIAALAQAHFLIKKDTENDRTFTDVKELTREERVLELARIIGGIDITETTLKIAQEMLENS